jgi:arsenate reductase
MYEDPKVSDGTPQQQEVYQERSEQIATEMKYVFSKINL